MARKDKHHHAFRRALEKEGWTMDKLLESKKIKKY